MLSTVTRVSQIYFPEHDLIPDDRVFIDLANAPLDDIPVGFEDGDNSVLQTFPLGVPQTPEMVKDQHKLQTVVNNRLALNANRIVPFSRTLKYTGGTYMRGKDVFALQRALAEAGFRKWGTFTYAYGTGTKKQVAAFQHKHGLKADGVYGLATHNKLKAFFDSYGASLMTQMVKTLAPSPAEKLLAYATFGYNQRYKIHYTQGSMRMYGVKHKIRPPQIPTYEDCSSFSTWCYWGAGLADPNGFGYNGFGYTGTLSNHGERTTDPHVGALAFYGGRWPYTHVAVYVGNGRVISHGSEIGPILVNAWYRPVSVFRRYF